MLDKTFKLGRSEALNARKAIADYVSDEKQYHDGSVWFNKLSN